MKRKKSNEKRKSQSPRELLEKQKRMYEEFNGPCVLCLEPDEEGKERLSQLRELLKDELFPEYDKFSPSSSVSTTSSLPKAVLDSHSSTFRAVVPIGSYPTVTSAVEMARKLKGLWDPVSFNVTDFHLISQEDESSTLEDDDFFDNGEYVLKKMTSWRHADIDEETLQSQGQYGCDALVMLCGEEVDTDQEGSKEMVDLLVNQGIPGGFELATENEKEANNLRGDELSLRNAVSEENTDETEDIELWLDETDEGDDGSVIVIGRCYFFTGSMRIYAGMPASSTLDAKDRILGLGTHASERRKGTARQQASTIMEGEELLGYQQQEE